MSTQATLSAAADERKARLARLRAIKRKQPDDEVVAPESDRASPAILHSSDAKQPDSENDDSATPDVARLHLSGRNYDPESRGAKLGFEAPPNLAAGEATLEAKAAKLEEEVRRQAEDDGIDGDDGEANPDSGNKEQQRQIDLFKLQPKKPNWDLKRALNKRLEPLNVRTDNAIARLVRQRLQAKQQETIRTTQQTAQQREGKGGASGAAGAAGAAGEDDGMGEDDGNTEGALEGAALVEGIRLREQEAEEEERREREAEEEEEARES